MKTNKLYVLPELVYPYNGLSPCISEDLLRLHYDKHHAAYVSGANAILQKMDKSRNDNNDFDAKAIFQEISLYIGRHCLHSRFWNNLAPAGEDEGLKAVMLIKKIIDEEYR